MCHTTSGTVDQGLRNNDGIKVLKKNKFQDIFEDLVMSCAETHKEILLKAWKHTDTSDKHRYGSLDLSKSWPQLEPIIAIILIQFD
ncbi:uncharacterized [Tachysurus ichikawai]